MNAGAAGPGINLMRDLTEIQNRHKGNAAVNVSDEGRSEEAHAVVGSGRAAGDDQKGRVDRICDGMGESAHRDEPDEQDDDE